MGRGGCRSQWPQQAEALRRARPRVAPFYPPVTEGVILIRASAFNANQRRQPGARRLEGKLGRAGKIGDDFGVVIPRPRAYYIFRIGIPP